MKPQKVTIGTATLYLGDAREVLPRLRYADALITDPPYGVNFKGKTTKNSGFTPAAHVYRDDEANFRDIVLPIVRQAIGLSSRAGIFTGKSRLQEYPEPRDIGGVFAPAGGSLGAWGFATYHPVLFYGPRPRIGCWPTTTRIHLTSARCIEQRNGHPCPKPIEYMEWLVGLASNPGDRVLDPFMGSGTTGVACAQLGRRFVGIEIEKKYFEIACRRIEDAQRAHKESLKSAA